MENTLVSAMLSSRSSFQVIREHINLKQYTRQFQILVGHIDEYYQRDTQAPHVDRGTLLELVSNSLRNEKHLQDFTNIVDQALALTVSLPNVEQVILSAKKEEVGDQLAAAIVNKDPKTEDLLERYQKLCKATELQTEGYALEVYRNVDLASLIASEYDPASFMQIMPLALNDKLDGGVKGGHHVVAFARPEAGKSMFAINAATGFARQGFKGIYLINEDRPKDIILRVTSNLTGMTKHQIRDDPHLAERLAKERGIDNLTIVSAAPGTIGQIAEELSKDDEYKWVVIDQLRNLKVKAENRTNQLEAAATGARNLAKEYNVAIVSVTQAGDSATGKKVLDQGDVDSSNTGIPAAADLMVGIGMDLELEQSNLRMITLCKNKLSGDHSSFPVRVEPQLSRVRSM